jgi:hypothetical protein
MTIANNGTLRMHVKVDRPYCNPMIKNPTYPTVTPWGIVEMTMRERIEDVIGLTRMGNRGYNSTHGEEILHPGQARRP